MLNKGNYGRMRESSTTICEGGRYPLDCLTFKAVERTVQPTQKPDDLLEYLIRTNTNEGEIVLDNCMGSGSTGVACLNTNRKFIGIELDDKYFEIAENRIKEAMEKKEELLKVFDETN